MNTIGPYYVANGGLSSVYSTAQFHFHWGAENSFGSEHQIDGQSFPLEVRELTLLNLFSKRDNSYLKKKLTKVREIILLNAKREVILTILNKTLFFQLHVVNYDSVNYASISQAMTEPGGLAVLGVLFRVRYITLVYCSSFTILPTEQQ